MTDTAPALQTRPFGPMDALYCALRRSLPQILAVHVRDPEEYIRVTYRAAGPADIAWDDDAEQYRWSAGATGMLGSRTELDRVVAAVAEHLDAVLLGGPAKSRPEHP